MTGRIREIRLYGDPVLRKKALPVTEFDDELKQLVADMFETMDDAYGAGLAAPQIGELKRVFVVNIYGEPDEEGERGASPGRTDCATTSCCTDGNSR